jgi:hypothetical protein
MADDTTLKVYNQDIAGFDGRLRRALKELQSSQSSMGNEFHPADLERFSRMIAAGNAYIDFVVGEPNLDVPETFQSQFTLEPFGEYVDVESEIVNDLQRQIIRMRTEMINSQSARRPAGFHPDDVKRFRDYLAKISKYLTDYVAKASPLDVPASSPEDKVGPAPLGGV